VDGDHVLAADLERAVRRLSDVEIDVGLVAHDEEAVLAREAQELLVMSARRAGAGGIVRIAIVIDRGARPIGRRNHIEIRQEAIGSAQRNRARCPAREEDGALVDGIGGIRVPADWPRRIQCDQWQMKDCLFRAGAGEDLALRIER
jgi:hypothetical protein